METIDWFNLKSTKANVVQAVCTCGDTVAQHNIDLSKNKATTKPCGEEDCDCRQWQLKGFEVIGVMKIPAFPLGHVR